MKAGRIVHSDRFWLEHALRSVQISGMVDFLVLTPDAWAATGFGRLVNVSSFADDAGGIAAMSLNRRIRGSVWMR